MLNGCRFLKALIAQQSKNSLLQTISKSGILSAILDAARQTTTISAMNELHGCGCSVTSCQKTPYQQNNRLRPETLPDVTSKPYDPTSKFR